MFNFQVIAALVSQKHIVTPAYIEKVVDHIKEGAAKPDPDLYVHVLAHVR